MTNVTLYTDETGEILKGFCVRDHSGFDDKGRDIVCAAVSVLTINTINAIEQFTEEKPMVRQDKDSITCHFDKAPGRDTELLLKTFRLGVESIRSEYGEHVRLEFGRYKSC